MKRFGICYATKHMRLNNQWDVVPSRGYSEQEAIECVLAFASVFIGEIICIANIVEWKGDPNGQYILTAA